MDRSGTNESLLDLGNPHRWMKSSQHWLCLVFCFPFLFEFLFEMPEAVDTACLQGRSECVLWVLYGLWKCVQQQQKSGRAVDWHHPKYQMMWMENHRSRWPRGNRSHVECFPLVWRKGPGYGFKWKTRRVLYCILLPFVLHFIVNWIYSEKIILC